MTDAITGTAAVRGAGVVFGNVVTVATAVGAFVTGAVVGAAVIVTVTGAALPDLKEVSLPYWLVAVRLTSYEPSRW